MQVTRDKTERPHGALLQLDIGLWYDLYRIGGSLGIGAPASMEASLGYHPDRIGVLTWYRDPVQGPCQVGSLTGAVAS